MRPFSPLMLQLARESRKLSQTALADLVGISQSAISQMESGVIVSPSDTAVQGIAEGLRYKPTLFYAPIRFQQLPITFFRKRKIGVKDANAIRARVNLTRLRIETLLKASEYSGPRLLLTNLEEERISAAEAARRLRVYWNVPPGPIKDLTALVENFGVIVVPMDFGTGAVDGMSIYEPGDNLPPMIFVSRSIPADRWRMTLGHETAHIDLHHHLQIPPPHERLEQEAFSYAAELLAPSEQIAGHLSRLSMHRLASLKKHWRVSMSSLVKRASEMGKLSERRERFFWIQLRRGGVDEPVDIEPERPSFLRKLVDYHLNELGYSMQQLSNTLHMTVEELRADFDLRPAPLKLA